MKKDENLTLILLLIRLLSYFISLIVMNVFLNSSKKKKHSFYVLNFHIFLILFFMYILFLN